MKSAWTILTLMIILLLPALLASCAGDDEDDNPGSNPGQTQDDDNDDADDDDDDDNNDDDDNDDNDTSPAEIWDALTPQGLPVDQVMGTSTQMYDGPDDNWYRDFEIPKLVEAGLFRLRASIDWPDVEPEQDQFTFAYSDPFVQLVIDAGLRFDGRLCYGVDWAAPDDNDSAIPPADFGDYAGHVAEHYCGVIDSWEIWNEENVKVFWQPEPDPQVFGDIMKAVFIAVHDACPDAKVVFGGLTPFEGNSLVGQGLYRFLDEVRAVHPDIGDYFDVMAIHPYTLGQTPTPEYALLFGDYEFWPSLPGQVRTARQRLADMGVPDKPIWATEYGWPSLLIGEQAQADFLVRGALLGLTEGVEAMDWYTFYDREPGSSTLPTEDYFGLYSWPDAEGGPQQKPVYRAARGLYRVLGDARYAGDLSAKLNLPAGVYGLGFMNEQTGQIYLAAWDGRFKKTTTLSLPCPAAMQSYEVLDEEGESVAEGGVVESLTLELTGQVTYVRFDLE